MRPASLRRGGWRAIDELAEPRAAGGDVSLDAPPSGGTTGDPSSPGTGIAVGEAPYRRSVLRRLLGDRTAAIGLALIVLLAAAAAFAPLLTPHDPLAQDVLNKHAPPSTQHLLGTDQLGRDELTRLLYGGRATLLTALALGTAVLAIGLVAGTVAGFMGGLVDAALMRIVDVLLAFPNFLLVLVVVGALGPGLFNLGVAVVIAGWVGYARVVRGLVLSARERPHVEAARSLGFGPWRLATRHVLPSVIGPVIVLWTVRTGQLLLALAALSFLGLGVQPPTAEWGAMLDSARESLAVNPSLMIWPGVMSTLAALGFNLLGDGLRDVLDPRSR
ncbi:MAG: ABC transporter permease [Acidimicrobiia bacterium]|jgi:peptide/nickel transport system permease protein|nr:ABC transporter permease [Acidimicrobiia bacterium]